MASKKTKDETTEDQTLENDEVQEAASEPLEGALESVAAVGIHERLEALELASIGGPQEKGSTLNRVTLLTGALKMSLPDLIKHVEDVTLLADLKALLAVL